MCGGLPALINADQDELAERMLALTWDQPTLNGTKIEFFQGLVTTMVDDDAAQPLQQTP